MDRQLSGKYKSSSFCFNFNFRILTHICYRIPGAASCLEVFTGRMHTNDAPFPPAHRWVVYAPNVVDDPPVWADAQPGELDNGFAEAYLPAATFAVVDLQGLQLCLLCRGIP
jgi:hypothetical protein